MADSNTATWWPERAIDMAAARPLRPAPTVITSSLTSDVLCDTESDFEYTLEMTVPEDLEDGSRPTMLSSNCKQAEVAVSQKYKRCGAAQVGTRYSSLGGNIHSFPLPRRVPHIPSYLGNV